MNILLKHGWKALGVIILLYVLVMGLQAPIAPSIKDVSPENVSTFQTANLRVHTKNTNLLAKKQTLHAYLISNDQALASDSAIVVNDTTILAKFKMTSWLLPAQSNLTLPDLMINSDYYGNIVMRSAISLSRGSDSSNCFAQSTPIKNITVSHFSPQYFTFPMREILYQSVRNLFFHVPMWFAMLTVFSLSCFFSINYLRTASPDNDLRAQSTALTGIIFGIAGLTTGSQWARATWGTWWTPDVKLNGAAITMLMYLAYTVLRASFEDKTMKARVSAVFNIFAYAIMIPLIMILPRLQDSLHPGNGGNPGFKTYDLDGDLRLVFYPAAIGWVILSLWIAQITYRVQKLRTETN